MAAIRMVRPGKRGMESQKGIDQIGTAVPDGQENCRKFGLYHFSCCWTRSHPGKRADTGDRGDDDH